MNQPTNSTTGSAARNRLRTLMVGSDSRIIVAVKRYMEQQGRFDVVGHGRTGWHGLQLMGEVAPRLVIVDFKIEDMSGAALTKILKGRPSPPIVIVVSGLGSRDHMDLSLRAGADAYIIRSDLDRITHLLEQLRAFPVG